MVCELPQSGFWKTRHCSANLEAAASASLGGRGAAGAVGWSCLPVFLIHQTWSRGPVFLGFHCYEVDPLDFPQYSRFLLTRYLLHEYSLKILFEPQIQCLWRSGN